MTEAKTSSSVWSLKLPSHEIAVPNEKKLGMNPVTEYSRKIIYKPAAKAASKSSLPIVTKIPIISIARAIYWAAYDSRLMKPRL
jgi:hypothetical protein